MKKFNNAQLRKITDGVKDCIKWCKSNLKRRFGRWEHPHDVIIVGMADISTIRWDERQYEIQVHLYGDETARVCVRKPKIKGMSEVEIMGAFIESPVHLQIVNAVAEAVFGK
jgi:hypothetical protein